MSDKVLKNFDLEAIENRSIFQPIPSVPNNPATSNIKVLWPRRGSSMYEVIEKLWAMNGRFRWWETCAAMETNKAYTLVNCYTGYCIGNIFRKALGLHTYAGSSFNVLVPSMVGSLLFDGYYQAKNVTTPMVLSPRSHHEPIICKSVFVHVVISVVYQTLFQSVASVYFANKSNTHPLPDNFFHVKESREYVIQKVLKKIIIDNKKTFLGIFLFNVAFGACWTSLQSYQIKYMYETLLEAQ